MTELLANNLGDVVNGRMSLGEFQDWFIVYVMGQNPIHPEDAATAEDIESAMAEFTGGHISEQLFRGVLRDHLANAAITAYLPGSRSSGRFSSSANRTQFERLVANG